MVSESVPECVRRLVIHTRERAPQERKWNKKECTRNFIFLLVAWMRFARSYMRDDWLAFRFRLEFRQSSHHHHLGNMKKTERLCRVLGAREEKTDSPNRERVSLLRQSRLAELERKSSDSLDCSSAEMCVVIRRISPHHQKKKEKWKILMEMAEPLLPLSYSSPLENINYEENLRRFKVRI